ncbi:MAG: fumarylacetoacetate hydrolase family protein [Proteobacteria bacterium]|nr:fumarylacetoacetate hydrolase family protein [Pseudomonadota bacterium]
MKDTYKLAMAALGNGPVPVLVVGDRVVGLAEATGRAAPAELIEVFSDWETHDAAFREAAAGIAQADGAPGIALSQARFEAPLRFPRKVVCAGANYYRHLVEMGVTEFEKTKPFFFFKPPTTTIVGPGATVRYPTGGDGFDWEIELAVVIGRQTRDVPLERALEAVAAYTVAIDLAKKVRTAMADFSGTMGTTVVTSVKFETWNDIFEDVPEVYRRVVDFIIAHR